MPSPLEKLLASEKELPEQDLVSTLEKLIRIHPTTGEIIPLQQFNTLSAKAKVLTVLLAAKVAQRLKRREKENISFSEFIRSIGIPRGTVAPMLRQLFEQHRLLVQDDDKSYLVPTHAVGQAIQFLRDDLSRVEKGDGEKRVQSKR